MIIETSKLEGAALDWSVAKAVGSEQVSFGVVGNTAFVECVRCGSWERNWRPSTDWSQGGQLVDHYLIEFRTQAKGCKVLAWAAHEPTPSEGPNHLVAACRAVVSVELGDTVDVPEELLS